MVRKHFQFGCQECFEFRQHLFLANRILGRFALDLQPIILGIHGDFHCTSFGFFKNSCGRILGDFNFFIGADASTLDRLFQCLFDFLIMIDLYLHFR